MSRVVSGSREREQGITPRRASLPVPRRCQPMSADDVERLGSLFESVTGRTSVVDTRREDDGSRAVEADVDGRAVDPAERHGLDDAIGDPDAVEVR